MPASEREWAQQATAADPPEPRRREGYGPNVRWQEPTPEQRVAAWRLVIFLFVFLAIVGVVFS